MSSLCVCLHEVSFRDLQIFVPKHKRNWTDFLNWMCSGWLSRSYRVFTPCQPDLSHYSGVSMGSLIWVLPTGLPTEDRDHHLRGEGAAAGQWLRKRAKWVPGLPPHSPMTSFRLYVWLSDKAQLSPAWNLPPFSYSHPTFPWISQQLTHHCDSSASWIVNVQFRFSAIKKKKEKNSSVLGWAQL